MSSTFLQTSAAIGIFRGDYEVIFAFDQTTDGRLLWEPINAGATNENWAEVTHTGDSWTEITVGGTTETWTEMVK